MLFFDNANANKSAKVGSIVGLWIGLGSGKNIDLYVQL